MVVWLSTLFSNQPSCCLSIARLCFTRRRYRRRCHCRFFSYSRLFFDISLAKIHVPVGAIVSLLACCLKLFQSFFLSPRFGGLLSSISNEPETFPRNSKVRSSAHHSQSIINLYLFFSSSWHFDIKSKRRKKSRKSNIVYFFPSFFVCGIFNRQQKKQHF